MAKKKRIIKSMNAKNKGNSFERKIANMLSNKFESKYNKSQTFRRNPDSGSYFGGLNESRMSTHHESSVNIGDIISPPDFKFTIECKHYQSPPNISALISQHVPQWDKWIEQALSDANKIDKNFLLIIKYNRIPEFVITDCKKFSGMSYKNYLIMPLNDLLEYENDEFFDS